MKIPGIRFICQPDHRRTFGVRLGVLLMVFAAMLMFSGPAFGAGGGHGEPKGWVATDTYRVMNFTVLVVGLFLLLRKPVANALNARIKGIKDQLEELEAKKASAEAELAKYTEKLAKLESEAGVIIEEYKKQGVEAKARILQEAESAAEKLEEQAKRNIEYEFAQAKTRLKEEVLEKAMARAEEIIVTKISADDQERLVDEYLDKVVA